jgi:hypothetical protein
MVLAAAVAVLAASCSESPKEKARAKRVVEDKALRASVNEFAKTANADTTWIKSVNELRDKSLNPVYSVDLERLWIIGRPVLFVGGLENVESRSDTNYQLSISEWGYLLLKLRLEVTCPKPKVDPILGRIASDRSNVKVNPGGVALAAQIERISSRTSDGEGSMTVLTGHGQCADLRYIGDVGDAKYFIINTERN